MKYYIFSKIDCLLKINGVCVGKIDFNLYFFEEAKEFFLECFPLDETYAPIRSYITNGACNNLKIYYLNGCAVIVPVFDYAFQWGFKNVLNETIDDLSVSVFLDGFYKALISTKEDFITLPLNSIPRASKAIKKENALFLLLYEKNATKILIFTLKPKITLKIKKEISDVIFNDENFLLTSLPPSIRQLKVTETYDYSLNLLSKKYQESRPISALSPFLLPFAFFEEVLLNAQFEHFLHPTLISHKDLVPSFFKDFFTFLPLSCAPPFKVLTVGKEAKIVDFVLTDGLISDFYFE